MRQRHTLEGRAEDRKEKKARCPDEPRFSQVLRQRREGLHCGGVRREADWSRYGDKGALRSSPSQAADRAVPQGNAVPLDRPCLQGRGRTVEEAPRGGEGPLR